MNHVELSMSKRGWTMLSLTCLQEAESQYFQGGTVTANCIYSCAHSHWPLLHWPLLHRALLLDCALAAGSWRALQGLRAVMADDAPKDWGVGISVFKRQEIKNTHGHNIMKRSMSKLYLVPTVLFTSPNLPCPIRLWSVWSGAGSCCLCPGVRCCQGPVGGWLLGFWEDFILGGVGLWCCNVFSSSKCSPPISTMFEFMSSSERHCRTLPSGERCARRCGRTMALAHTMMVALGLMRRRYNGWMWKRSRMNGRNGNPGNLRLTRMKNMEGSTKNMEGSTQAHPKVTHCHLRHLRHRPTFQVDPRWTQRVWTGTTTAETDMNGGTGVRPGDMDGMNHHGNHGKTRAGMNHGDPPTPTTPRKKPRGQSAREQQRGSMWREDSKIMMETSGSALF